MFDRSYSLQGMGGVYGPHSYSTQRFGSLQGFFFAFEDAENR
jgi:hypothetical protein